MELSPLKSVFFSLAFLLLLLPLSSASQLSEDYFTRHGDLLDVVHVVLDDNPNLFINNFGEPELFFNSANPHGTVTFQPSVGDQILLDTPRVVKLKPSSGEPVLEDMPKGIDGFHVLLASAGVGSADSNSIFIEYSPLTGECGGNYALIANVLNPVFPGEQREVKLRLHLPCQSDMVIVLSPKMGNPSREFTDSLFRYVTDTGTDYGNTIKIVTLPTSVFSSGDPTQLEIDKEVSLTSGGNTQPLIGSLYVSLRHNFQKTPSGFQYAPNFEIADAEHDKVIDANGQVPLSQVVLYPELDFRSSVKRPSFMDVEWSEVRVTLPGKPPVAKYLFPKLCKAHYYLNGDLVYLLDSVPGFFANCEEAETLLGLASGSVVEGNNGKLEVLSQGSATVVKTANVQIYGASRTLESIHIAKNMEAADGIKRQLARLRKVYSPSYFMLIGSTNDIPMPSEAYSNMFSLDGLNPADILYVYSKGDPKVDVEMARIPIALDEPDPWGFAAEVLKNSLASRIRTFQDGLIVSDACGKNGNCFIGEATRTAAVNYWRSCANNPDCLLGPPHCKLTQGTACRGVSEVATRLASADFVHVNGRSTAEDFYYVDSHDSSSTLFGATDVLPAGNNGFIASTTASYAGSIDSSFSQFGGLEKDGSLTFSFLNAGAGLVIANPRMGIIQRVPLPLLEFEHVVLKALKDKDSRSIGKIINERRNALLSHNLNELFTFSALHGETYGDPLLRVYRG